MKRDRDREAAQAQRLWRLSAMGGELAFGIVGMILLGLGVDYFFKTEPWGVVLGAVLGVIGAGYNFIRQALLLNKGAAAGIGRGARPLPEEPEEKSEDPDGEFRTPPDFDKY